MIGGGGGGGVWNILTPVFLGCSSFQTELGGPSSRLEHTFSEVRGPPTLRPHFQAVSQSAGEAGRD